MQRVPAAHRRLSSDDSLGGSARTDALGERLWRGERRPSQVAGAFVTRRGFLDQDAAPCDRRGPHGHEGSEVSP